MNKKTNFLISLSAKQNKKQQFKLTNT